MRTVTTIPYYFPTMCKSSLSVVYVASNFSPSRKAYHICLQKIYQCDVCANYFHNVTKKLKNIWIYFVKVASLGSFSLAQRKMRKLFPADAVAIKPNFTSRLCFWNSFVVSSTRLNTPTNNLPLYLKKKTYEFI